MPERLGHRLTPRSGTLAREPRFDGYLSHTSTEGRARVAAAMRRLEVRIGKLLGPAEHGGRREKGQVGHDQLDSRERHDFRTMAAHADTVEDVIAYADCAYAIRRCNRETNMQSHPARDRA